jgi:hypothetical protein
MQDKTIPLNKSGLTQLAGFYRIPYFRVSILPLRDIEFHVSNFLFHSVGLAGPGWPPVVVFFFLAVEVSCICVKK